MQGLSGFKEEELEKIRALEKLGSEITIIWAGTASRFDEWKTFRVFGLLDYKKYFDKPDCGSFIIEDRWNILLFLEALNKFGDRFPVSRSILVHPPMDVGWTISGRILVTIFFLFENPHSFEEFIKTAENEEEFLALAALRESTPDTKAP